MKILSQITQNTRFIQRAYLFSLLLFAISLYSPKLPHTNIAIMFLIAVWVLEGKFREKYNRLKANLITYPFIALFILYLAGIFYTEVLLQGIKSLETKTSLLVFPIVLGSIALKPEHLHKTLLFFAYSCAGLSVIALAYQSFVVLEKNDFNYFFSDGLVSIMDKKAVYYAMYVAFSILILVYDLWHSFTKATLVKKSLAFATTTFLLLFLFLLASRTSLGILLLIMTSTLIVLGIRKGKLKYTILLFTVLVAFMGGLSIVFPQTVARFKSLQNVSYDFSNTEGIYHFSGEDSNSKWNGLNFRLAKWSCALDVVQENPLTGVGTGDVKDEMVVAYRKKSFTYAAEGRFDPHNQYFHTTVAIGIPGLILLLCCYTMPLIIAYKRKNWLLGAFQVTIIVCSLTESILSSAQGIIFYCFFVFLLMNTPAKPILQIGKEPKYSN